jgi:hypothetical protein
MGQFSMGSFEPQVGKQKFCIFNWDWCHLFMIQGVKLVCQSVKASKNKAKFMCISMVLNLNNDEITNI